MKNNDLLKKIAGVALIIGGIAGLFLPFLQGIFMIALGATLLGNRRVMAWVRKWTSPG